MCRMWQDVLFLQTFEASHPESIYDGVQFGCKECGKGFTKNIVLRQHTRSVQDGVKHTCIKYGKQLSQTDHLRYHIESMHEGG